VTNGISVRLAALLAALSLLLGGCWDRKEINDVAFVLGSAVDKEGELYRATIQIALPGKLGGQQGGGGGGGTSGTKPWYTASKTAETIREANLKEQQDISRTLNFSHRRTLVIGEALAKEGIEPIMDVMGRIPQNRLTALVLVSRGPSGKVLSTEVPYDQFPAEALREMASSAFRVPRTMKIVINLMLMDGIDVALPAVSLGQTSTMEGGETADTIQIDGLALFSHNKLAGFLSGSEAEGVLWAMGQIRSPEIVVKAPEGEGKIIARFFESETEVHPSVRGGEVRYRIDIRARGTIIENQSTFQLNDHDHLERLEDQLEKKIREDVEAGLKRMVDMRSDAVGLGKTLHSANPRAWRRLKNGWHDRLASLRFVVDPTVDIENIGSVVKPLGRREEHLR